MRQLFPLTLSLSALVVISGCQENPEETEGTEVEFTHIHGLGFTEDGQRAYIPAHDGLRVFENGTWSVVEDDQHDFMGFTMTANGFYSSGHPSMQTDYENPFGLIKSTDGGESIELLALEGEIDFHLMSAGYHSDAIYVINPEPNSSMDELGLHRTLDEGQEWNKGDMTGVSGEVIAIAAHPEEESVIALSTTEGAFLSEDAGDSFEQVLSGSPVPAITFSHSGGELLVAEGTEEETRLKVINTSGESEADIPAPAVKSEDALSYLSQNPQSEDTIMVTTMERDIFYTENGGETWEQLAEEGKSRTTSEGT
ncbi:F510_1955 family glycosylhydrolase [Shouchella shacheensis]|uniref:F510_1955 family glycosylhydrolase n=1 Tax=Shouchella shacheensis TaxID=1649580 RepID=UPI00073FDBFE|nr:hypothetical protein [Shouchella shacheensis]